MRGANANVPGAARRMPGATNAEPVSPTAGAAARRRCCRGDRDPSRIASGRPSPTTSDAGTQTRRVFVDLDDDLVVVKAHDLAQQRLRADLDGFAQLERSARHRVQHGAADRTDGRPAHEDPRAARGPCRGTEPSLGRPGGRLMSVCSRCRSSLRADLGAIGEEAAERAVDDVAARGDPQAGDDGGVRDEDRRHADIRRDPAADDLLLAGRPSGFVRDAPLAARQRARGRGDDGVDPRAAHAVVLPARAQHVGESPPAQLQQRRGALLIVEAAPRVELGVRRRDAIVRAPPLLGEDFANARAQPPRAPPRRVPTRAPAPRPGSPRTARERSPSTRSSSACARTFERHGFHAQLPAQARGEIRQRDVALRIGHDQHQRRKRHERRSQRRRRRSAPRPPRRRAPAASARAPPRTPPSLAGRRDAHLRSGQAVSGRGDFVAEVDRGPHHARRFRIRIDTMRP